MSASAGCGPIPSLQLTLAAQDTMMIRLTERLDVSYRPLLSGRLPLGWSVRV